MRDRVDDFVARLVIARLRRDDARELLTAPDASRPDVPALRGEAMALRARIDAAASEFADDAAASSTRSSRMSGCCCRAGVCGPSAPRRCRSCGAPTRRDLHRAISLTITALVAYS